jgi:hypothetical protein
MAYGTVHLLLFNMHSLIFNHFGSGKDCLSILSVEFSLLFSHFMRNYVSYLELSCRVNLVQMLY